MDQVSHPKSAPPRRPTITDIATIVGVSKVTVSNALNGRPGVSEATRARIAAVADEIGFVRNSAARALSGARSSAVGLALCRPARMLGTEPFFMELVGGIENVLSDSSYSLALQVVSDHERGLEAYRRWWGERHIDGAILVDLRTDDPRIPALEQLGLPTVVIGHPSGSGSLTPVWSDDAAAVRETLEYLAALGHRRVARVAGLPGLVHTAIRDEAFARVCAELGLQALPPVHTDCTGQEGARATRRLLLTPERPTAVLYDNDITAVAGLSVAQEMGLRVPADLSIVAWDDSPLVQVVRPALTALTRDIHAYGANAARTLLSLISGRQPGGYEDLAPRVTPPAAAPHPRPDRPDRPDRPGPEAFGPDGAGHRRGRPRRAVSSRGSVRPDVGSGGLRGSVVTQVEPVRAHTASAHTAAPDRPGQLPGWEAAQPCSSSAKASSAARCGSACRRMRPRASRAK
ncbi:LacI family DNA-binding transcriptional regulator [Streptomyces sp. CB01881]|uniref:LacI family DNA-binding transcriptional regulator n=1 Tax=Streptomyces sp. CB01881 TaxID=2078691 RepID=UPI003211CC48